MGYLLILLLVIAIATPCAYAAVSQQTSQSVAKSATSQTISPTKKSSAGCLWEKIGDYMPTMVNPLSDISVRDAGVKPRVRPHLFTDTGFTSNPNAAKKAIGAWQARISPGLTVEMPISSKLYAQIDYTYSFATTQGPRYSDNNNNHNLSNLLRYDLSNATTFGITNNFQVSDLPDNAGKRFLLETVRPEITHKFGEKLRSALNYQFQHFRDIGPLDTTTSDPNITRDSFNDNAINGSLTYDATKKLSIMPNFGWSLRNFNKTSQKNYWEIRPDMRATYGLGAKTTLTGHMGWSYRRFRQGGDSSELIYGVGANHLFGSKVVWGIAYDKSQQDTFDTRFINRDTPVATNLDNYDRHFRVVNVHRFGTTGTYNFNEKSSVNGFSDFLITTTRRIDNIADNAAKNDEKKMELGAMYRYRLTRWIDFRLGYTFGRSFDSDNNTARSTYTYHKVTVGANVNI